MTRHLQFCDESESVSLRLCSLVAAGYISGKAIHDANIVATLMEQGIELLAMGNPEDFSGYPEIGIVRLSEVETQLSAANRPR
jgi:hypothetical protein